MPMPVPQIADLPPLQDAASLASQLAATLVASNVTIPMPQGNTGPGTILGTTAHNVATAANRAPSFSRRLPVARALPMQVGTPLASASLMQVTTPAASLHMNPGHAFTAEEALLQGATLPSSPWQKAHLLNPPVVLMDNHIKMMDTLQHLASYGLQFICKSVEALHRERMPTQAPPGYRTLQASDIPCGSLNNPLLSQEFYRATSNLSTAIVEPQQVPPQQCPVGNCCPDPEIESAITNMHSMNKRWVCHQRIATTTHGEGTASAALSLHATLDSSCHLSSPSGIQKTEDQRPKAPDHRSLATSLLPYALVTLVFLLLEFLYLFATCVLFRKTV